MKKINYKKIAPMILSASLVSPYISCAVHSHYKYLNSEDSLDYYNFEESNNEAELDNEVELDNENTNSDFIQDIKKIEDFNVFIEGTNKVYFNDLDSSTKVTDSWNYKAIKTITINANVKNLDKNSRYVEIHLPLGMVLKMTPESIVDQRTIISVDTSQFNKTSINTSNSGTYKPKMGVLKYYLSENIESITMDILVSVDAVLWNTINDISATSSSDNAVKVIVGDNSYQAIKKLDDIKVTGRDWSSYRNLTFLNNVLNGNDFRISYTSTIDFVQNTSTRLYKQISTSMEIPYYEYVEDGVTKRKYAEVKNISIGQSGSYKIEDNKILVTWNNAYISTISFYIDVGTASLNCSDDTVLKFKCGKMYVKEYFTENEHSVYNETNSSVTIISRTQEKFSFSSTSRGVYKPNTPNYHNNLTYMGGYRIVNLGADSKPKKIEFDFPKSGVGVKGVRLITSRAAGAYTINFSLWNKNTGDEITSTATINKGSSSSDHAGYYFYVSNAIKLTNLNISNSDDYYFKNINYVVQSFPTGYYSYSSGGSESTDSSGNIVGIVFPETPINTTHTFTYSTYDMESGLTLQDKRSTTVTIKSNGDATMGLTSGSFTNENGSSINEINSGKNFFIKSKLEVAKYPYRSTTYVANPVIHLKLPAGFLINESKTSFEIITSSSSIPLKYIIKNKDNPRVSSDGHFIYDITFIDNPGLGYFTENLDSFGYLNISINIRVSNSVKTMSTKIRETLFVSDENITIGGGGAWDKYFVKDTYDINNNGSKTDTIATVPGETALNIISNSNWLEVNWFVSKNKEEFKEATQVSLNTSSDTLEFKLNINNVNEGITRAGNFYYFIPIPKKNIDYPLEAKNPNKLFHFDLKLNEKVQTPEGFKALYSTNNQTFKEWSDTIDLNNVTMVKIVSTKDILEGDTADIIFNMSYIDKSVIPEGNYANMSIYGYQDYEKNGGSLKYNHIFDGLQIEIDIAPEILFSPTDINTNINEDASFTTIVDRGAPYANGYWQYKKKGSNIWIDTITTDLNFTLENVDQSFDECQIRYVLSNKNGTVYSDIATLSVYGFFITIPKNISLDNTSDIPYEIEITGNIPSTSRISITPHGERTGEKFFRLLEKLGLKKPITVNIKQAETDINSDDIYFDKTKHLSGEIQSETLSAGNWSGVFNFDIIYKN